jgi:hypothetical protein
MPQKHQKTHLVQLWQNNLITRTEVRNEMDKEVKIDEADTFLQVVDIPKIQDIGITKFAQAMPEQYKHTDTVIAYRNYYKHEKRNIANWKNGEPEWWE